MIWYPGLHTEEVAGGSEWWYGEGRNRARIYAGKADENLVQALARDCLAESVAAVYAATGFCPALLVHDEVVMVVPSSEADAVQIELDVALRKPTSWWPDLLKWSESDIADTYGDAK